MSLVLYGLMSRAGAQAAGQAAAAKSAASAAATSADLNARHLRSLEERVDRLALLTLALAETVKAKTGATDEEILRQVSLLDLLDGVPDGKLARSAQKCAGCARVISARHEKCLFCGCEKMDPLDEGTLQSMVL
jgi:hypothetical protein